MTFGGCPRCADAVRSRPCCASRPPASPILPGAYRTLPPDRRGRPGRHRPSPRPGPPRPRLRRAVPRPGRRHPARRRGRGGRLRLPPVGGRHARLRGLGGGRLVAAAAGALPACDDGSRDAELVRLIHRAAPTPPRIAEPYPAHLHIDLLERARGRGLGRLLIDRLLGGASRPRRRPASTWAWTRRTPTPSASTSTSASARSAMPGRPLMGLRLERRAG